MTPSSAGFRGATDVHLIVSQLDLTGPRTIRPTAAIRTVSRIASRVLVGMMRSHSTCCPFGDCTVCQRNALLWADAEYRQHLQANQHWYWQTKEFGPTLLTGRKPIFLALSIRTGIEGMATSLEHRFVESARARIRIDD